MTFLSLSLAFGLLVMLGGQMIERSDDTMCNLHRAQGDEDRRFFG
jgi:hypothetical protein